MLLMSSACWSGSSSILPGKKAKAKHYNRYPRVRTAEGVKRMASCSQPSQGPMSYHRPRPSLSHAASTPPVVSGRAEDRVQAVETVNCKPLPSRPANHLQQQHCAHSKSFDSRFNPTTSSLTDCLNTTEVLPLPDEEVLASRPPLTSKFSFDNLAAMSDGSESGGAFKKMVTR